MRLFQRYPDEGSDDQSNDESSDSGEEESDSGHPAHFMFHELQWSDQRSNIEIPEFQEQVGPVKILPAESLAKDFFSLLVDDRMLDCIVHETNKMPNGS